MLCRNRTSWRIRWLRKNANQLGVRLPTAWIWDRYNPSMGYCKIQWFKTWLLRVVSPWQNHDKIMTKPITNYSWSNSDVRELKSPICWWSHEVSQMCIDINLSELQRSWLFSVQPLYYQLLHQISPWVKHRRGFFFPGRRFQPTHLRNMFVCQLGWSKFQLNGKAKLPSCNQTWRAGKWTIFVGDCPS